MKIEELRINQKVRHGHDVASIVELDMRSNHAVLLINGNRYKTVNVNEIQKHELDLPTGKEVPLSPGNNEVIGFANISMLKSVLFKLHAGNVVYGKHEQLGEIIAVMNQQKNRISISPINELAKKPTNQLKEQEFCHHVLFYPWKWFIIEKFEES